MDVLVACRNYSFQGLQENLRNLSTEMRKGQGVSVVPPSVTLINLLFASSTGVRPLVVSRFGGSSCQRWQKMIYIMQEKKFIQTSKSIERY